MFQCSNYAPVSKNDPALGVACLYREKHEKLFLSEAIRPGALIFWSVMVLPWGHMLTRVFLAGNEDNTFCKIRPGTEELAALELLQISSCTYNGRNAVTTLVPSFLDVSSLFLQVARTVIKA